MTDNMQSRPSIVTEQDILPTISCSACEGEKAEIQESVSADVEADDVIDEKTDNIEQTPKEDENSSQPDETLQCEPQVEPSNEVETQDGASQLTEITEDSDTTADYEGDRAESQALNSDKEMPEKDPAVQEITEEDLEACDKEDKIEEGELPEDTKTNGSTDGTDTVTEPLASETTQITADQTEEEEIEAVEHVQCEKEQVNGQDKSTAVQEESSEVDAAVEEAPDVQAPEEEESNDQETNIEKQSDISITVSTVNSAGSDQSKEDLASTNEVTQADEKVTVKDHT